MGFLSVIRRWALRDKMPIREIARRTGLSRNTIKKYLREDAVEPRFKTPSRPSKLDPYADRLSAWLLAQTRKSRKERRNVKLMYEDLVKLGYDGSYERVAAFARAWRADRHRAELTTGRGTFVPLVFQPGEAFQFDWSEDWATIGGERVKLQVAHTKLSHSRAFIVRAYPLQTHEMLFDAHWHAFRVFGGIPGRGIYDNMKTAVDRVGRGKQRDVNARFQSMASHYVFEPEFCNPAAGWEKGQVEKNVRDARNRLWQVMPVFKDLEELNQWLEDRCIALWSETAHRELPGSIADAWEAEKPLLMVLPPAFDGFVEHSKRVSPTCLITFERNRYSVPASFANRPVSLRIYPERLVIVAEGQTICTHDRIIERSHRKPGRVIYDWRHYLAVIQRKPGALRNGAPFTEMPDIFRRLQDHMLRKEGGDREMVDVLSLVLHHDEGAVLRAVELALEAGLPPGVLNVVTGKGSVVGEAMGLSMDVDVLVFTGSGATGRRLMEYSARSNMKRVYLELGGKSPNIVFADAPNLEEAAKVAAGGIFRNAGQVCVAGSRLLVEAAIHDDFVAAVAKVADGMQVGDPLSLSTQIGAVNSAAQLDQNLGFVETAQAEGADLVTGGARILQDTGGYFMEPTILTGVTPDATLSQKEVFGPVLGVTPFDTDEEAIRLANSTVYGLAGAAWTANLSRAHKMVRGVRTGVMHINTYGGADGTVPLGGVGQSGNGADKSLHAIDKYINLKTAWIKL